MFCASDLTNGLERLGDSRISKQLALAEIRDWIADDPLARRRPGVALHRCGRRCTANWLLDRRRVRNACTDIKLFTNRVQLANCDYRVSGARIRRVRLVALFEARPSRRSITKRAASFDQTFAALDNLLRLRGPGVRIVVRLLVAEQVLRAELPDIVGAVHAGRRHLVSSASTG